VEAFFLYNNLNLFTMNLESVYIGMIIGGLIGIGVYVLFLINLQNLLKQVSPQNRQVPPANVWLLFIPLFSIVYQFILYPKISDSVEQEFRSRGTRLPGDYGRNLGMAMAILSVVSMFQYIGIPYIGNLASLAGLIIFIVYWVKTAELKNKLIALPQGMAGLSNRADLLD